MRITRWGEYGILCCVFLGQKGDGNPIGAAEISEAQQIPIQYAQQILHRLKKGNIITSVRGPNGGYKLADAPHSISLKDILYAAEGNTFELICEENPIRENCGTHVDCGLQLIWRELKDVIDVFLQGKSLAELIELHTEARPISPDGLVSILPRQ